MKASWSGLDQPPGLTDAADEVRDLIRRDANSGALRNGYAAEAPQSGQDKWEARVSLKCAEARVQGG